LSRLEEGVAGRVAAKLMAPDIIAKEEPSLSLSKAATSQLAWHPVCPKMRVTFPGVAKAKKNTALADCFLILGFILYKRIWTQKLYQ
jgi:hypothetical protein